MNVVEFHVLQKEKKKKKRFYRISLVMMPPADSFLQKAEQKGLAM